MCASATLSEVTVLSVGDVGAAHHPGDVHELVALIELQGLVALHHQIAVGLNLHHRHGEAARQAVALRARALAVETVAHRSEGRVENRHALGR